MDSCVIQTSYILITFNINAIPFNLDLFVLGVFASCIKYIHDSD